MIALQEFLASKSKEEEEIFSMAQKTLGGKGILFVIYNNSNFI
jgi:hypothetical protein